MPKKPATIDLDCICKMLQNARWHLDLDTNELDTQDLSLVVVAAMNEKFLQTATARLFYCDNVDIRYLEIDGKSEIILRLNFLREEDDDLGDLDTMGVDTEFLLKFFMIRQFVKEHNLKVKIDSKTRRELRAAFNEAIEGLQTILRSKNPKWL